MATTEQRHGQNQDKTPRGAAAPAIDPVCGASLDSPDPNLNVRRDGKDYQFCSASCRDRFRANPEMFI